MSEKNVLYLCHCTMTDCQEQELRFHLFLRSLLGKLFQNSKTLPLIEVYKGGLLKNLFFCWFLLINVQLLLFQLKHCVHVLGELFDTKPSNLRMYSSSVKSGAAGRPFTMFFCRCLIADVRSNQRQSGQQSVINVDTIQRNRTAVNASQRWYM